MWPCAEHVRHVPLLSLEKTLPDNATRAAIAQLGERQTEELKVPGSIPGLGIPCQGWGLSAAVCSERQTSAPCGKSGARLGRHVSASDEEMVHGSGHLASEDKGSCNR